MDTNQWIRRNNENWEVGEFIISFNHYARWLRMQKQLPTLLNKISDSVELPMHKFEFEEIENNKLLLEKIKQLGFPLVTEDLTTNLIPTGINYKSQCINYDEVVLKLQEAWNG
jgi:hypothetical protein